MAATTGHRSKRQNNQSAITSFFTAGDPTHNGQPHEREASNTVLPSHIQSSLLNVGMRVRKSVPEGYKNKAAEETPPMITTIPSPSTQRAELQPFCGLHKTGGILSQPSTPYQPVGAYDNYHSSAFPSQSTMGSQRSFDGDDLRALRPSAFGSSNKRALDEDDLDDDALLDEMEQAAAPRVFAQPRGKGRAKSGMGMAVAGFTVPPDDFDFDEADFLRPGEEMEL